MPNKTEMILKLFQCFISHASELLHRVPNLSPKMDSATAISFITLRFQPFDADCRTIERTCQFRLHCFFRFI